VLYDALNSRGSLPGNLQRMFQNWSDGNQVLTASFFFWAAGMELGKSCEGCLRSLLLQIMEQDPDTAAYAVRFFYGSSRYSSGDSNIHYACFWMPSWRMNSRPCEPSIGASSLTDLMNVMTGMASPILFGTFFEPRISKCAYRVDLQIHSQLSFGTHRNCRCKTSRTMTFCHSCKAG
jgi:hypothetical protein